MRVRDLAASLRFYRDALGCTLERSVDELGLYQLRAGTGLIDLVPIDSPLGRAGGPAPSGRNIDHFAVALEAMEPSAIRQWLHAHGFDCGPVEQRYGAEGLGPSIYVTDPDGNVVELKGPPTGQT